MTTPLQFLAGARALQGEGQGLPVQLSGSIPVVGADGENPASDANPLPARLANASGAITDSNRLPTTARTGTEVVRLYSGNPAALETGKTAADYEIRSTSQVIHRWGHAEDGVVDQAVFIDNDLDQEVNVQLFAAAHFGGEASQKTMGVLFSATDVFGARLQPGQTLFLMPDTTGITPTTSDRLVASVPALKEPHERLELRVVPNSGNPAPTTGEVRINVVRRY